MEDIASGHRNPKPLAVGLHGPGTMEEDLVPRRGLRVESWERPPLEMGRTSGAREGRGALVPAEGSPGQCDTWRRDGRGFKERALTQTREG